MMAITPFINHRFRGQIWKFLIDEQAGLLVAEIRNPEAKQTSFTAIRFADGRINFDGFVLQEPWLSGLEGCYDGVILLHGYQSAQSPAHKGITAVDGHSGNTLWADYNIAVDHIGQNGPIAYSIHLQPRKLFLLDVRTGATLRPHDPSDDVVLTSKIVLPDILPAPPLELSNFFDGEVTGNVLYTEHNDFRIVSLHTCKHSVFRQLLLVIQNNHLVYEELLNDNIQKLQPEAFIMYNDKLICIKNANELKILNL